MATLAEIRAKLQASSQQGGGQSGGGDNAIYPHWNMPEGKLLQFVSFLTKTPTTLFSGLNEQ